jgi:hypothetical protein
MDNKTAEVIQAIAAKLGTTAEYLWSVLIRQAFVTGVTSSLVVIMAVIGMVVLKKLWSKNPYDPDEFDVFPVRIPIGIAMLVCCGLIFGYSQEAINAFLNPEFWALDYVVNRL